MIKKGKSFLSHLMHLINLFKCIQVKVILAMQILRYIDVKIALLGIIALFSGREANQGTVPCWALKSRFRITKEMQMLNCGPSSPFDCLDEFDRNIVEGRL